MLLIDAIIRLHLAKFIWSATIYELPISLFFLFQVILSLKAKNGKVSCGEYCDPIFTNNSIQRLLPCKDRSFSIYGGNFPIHPNNDRALISSTFFLTRFWMVAVGPQPYNFGLYTCKIMHNDLLVYPMYVLIMIFISVVLLLTANAVKLLSFVKLRPQCG